MIIGKYIRRLLEEGQRVILPGFGNLEITETSGIPGSGGRMNPPGSMVRFDASFSKDDGLLASTLTEREGVDPEKATQWILELVDAIRFALDKGEPCSIPETGTFTRDADGKIHFRADPQWVLEPESYGLEPVDLLELEDVANDAEDEGVPEERAPAEESPEEEELTIPDGKYEELEFAGESEPEPATTNSEGTGDQVTSLYREGVPREKGKRPSRRWRVIWIVAAFLVVALLVLIFIPTDRWKRGAAPGTGTGTAVEEPRTVPEDATIPETDETTSEGEIQRPQQAEETEPEETQESAPAKYFIIAGSFSHLSYASDLQDQLRSRGYPAEVMVTRNRMYRVSVASFPGKEEAERELAAIRRTPGLESCWLLAN